MICPLEIIFMLGIDQALTLYIRRCIWIPSEQLELKLGMGGTSYEDFIRNMHLPLQLRYWFWALPSWSRFWFCRTSKSMEEYNYRKTTDSPKWEVDGHVFNVDVQRSGSNCGLILWGSRGSDLIAHGCGDQQCKAARTQALSVLSWNRCDIVSINIAFASGF